MKNEHLLELVMASPNLLNLMGQNNVPKAYTFPFLILIVQVPKIFIKKVVGYQERTLTQLKKQF